jgi:hypothetical protein
MSDFIEIVKNLEDLPLKWLHRARNKFYLRPPQANAIKIAVI